MIQLKKMLFKTLWEKGDHAHITVGKGDNACNHHFLFFSQ